MFFGCFYCYSCLLWGESCINQRFSEKQTSEGPHTYSTDFCMAYIKFAHLIRRWRCLDLHLREGDPKKPAGNTEEEWAENMSELIDGKKAMKCRPLDMPRLLCISPHWSHGCLHKTKPVKNLALLGKEPEWPILGRGATGSLSAHGCWWRRSLLSFGDVDASKLPTPQWKVLHPWTWSVLIGFRIINNTKRRCKVGRYNEES